MSRSTDSRSRAHRRARVRPDINVTPLVDVVLVLLIIFMVVTPQMEAGAAVELPVAAHPDDARASEEGLEPITLSLSREGVLYLEKEPLAQETLATRLTELHRRFPERTLVLKADRALPYGKVRQLFQLCQSLDLPGLHLQVLGQERGAKE